MDQLNAITITTAINEITRYSQFIYMALFFYIFISIVMWVINRVILKNMYIETNRLARESYEVDNYEYKTGKSNVVTDNDINSNKNIDDIEKEAIRNNKNRIIISDKAAAEIYSKRMGLDLNQLPNLNLPFKEQRSFYASIHLFNIWLVMTATFSLFLFLQAVSMQFSLQSLSSSTSLSISFIEAVLSLNTARAFMPFSHLFICLLIPFLPVGYFYLMFTDKYSYQRACARYTLKETGNAEIESKAKAEILKEKFNTLSENALKNLYGDYLVNLQRQRCFQFLTSYTLSYIENAGQSGGLGYIENALRFLSSGIPISEVNPNVLYKTMMDIAINDPSSPNLIVTDPKSELLVWNGTIVSNGITRSIANDVKGENTNIISLRPDSEMLPQFINEMKNNAKS